MKPFDPQVLRTVPEARRPFVALGAVGVAQGAATIATAFALTGVVVAIARSAPITTPLAWLVGLFVARAVLAAAAEYAAAHAGATVTTAVRARLLGAWASEGEGAGAGVAGGASAEGVGGIPTDPAARLTLATSGCASVEPYAARYLPALVAAAVVPAVAVATLALVDWPSALVVVLTLPLLPLFAALIGRTTQDDTQRRWRALADLGGHFLDVVRGLPTLVNYGRAERQLASIGEVTERHRRATMRTLRTAFLSSAALELLATISVAIVAVLCGVRLARGTMPLDTAMVAILLAPEAYWPIRRVGQEFHSAADGAEALAAIQAELDAPTRQSRGTQESRGTQGAPAATVDLTDVTYTYPGADAPVLAGLSLHAGPGLTVVTGESGAGKTTLLELVCGIRRPESGVVRAPACHLVTQRPFLPTGSLRRLMTLGNTAGTQAIWEALRDVGLDGVVAALPDGLETVVGDDGFGLSAGQRARVGLARALLAPESVILLDEPTAHLDDESAAIAHAAIRELASRKAVVAVTHRAELVEVADRHTHLARTRRGAVAS
ncbi:MAG: thiol reductant ABC exporter subunit CydD [Tetrasphaera sp.]|nr:thiol reductant ABC exporter subunit CydD [Tetrasphaera sp.]